MTISPDTRPATLLSLLGLALAASACDLEPADMTDDEPVAARTGTTPPVWHPRPIAPQLCNNPEVEPSRPPTGGACEIEVRLKETRLVDGQGLTEGRAELSVTATGGLAGALPGSEVHYPSVGGVPGVAMYNDGENKGMDLSLGTYTVAAGDTELVEVCVGFTEHDNGGVNGGDDVAEICETVTLRCDVAVGQQTYTSTLGPEDLCGDNTCNGRVSALIEVIRADADDDGIVNADDPTPEPCDELDKGKAGVGLLMYYHYEDDGLIGLGQAIGTNLAKHYNKYDRVVLVADNAASNPNNVNAEAFKRADIVFAPTRDGLLDAFQDLTSAGYRFDVLVHSHGNDLGQDDARIEVLSGGSINGDWLLSATEPNVYGTARGGLPIVSFWTTACFAGRMADAWVDLGAQVGSGAQHINFFPAAYGNYWDAWVAGTAYGPSVNNSVTPGVATAAALFIEGEAMGSPWFCNDVLLASTCAEEFFVDLGPGDEAAYDLSDIYDYTLTGAQNMAVASTRIFDGNKKITFGGAGAVWP